MDALKDDIVQEGLKLKYNLYNLKKDFAQLIADSNFSTTDIHQQQNMAAMVKPTISSPHIPTIRNCTPQLKRQRRDIVLVSSDFNEDRAQNSDPTGLIVNDKPSMASYNYADADLNAINSIPRSVYRSHKKRLMARRESGDGAPADTGPRSLQRRSGSCTPQRSGRRVSSSGGVSPMRRIPVKGRLSDAGSPFPVLNSKHQQSPQQQPNARKSINFALSERLSPEGTVSKSPQVFKSSSSMKGRITSQFKDSMPGLTQDMYGVNNHGQVISGKTGYVKSEQPSSRRPRAMKKHFPKTPSKAVASSKPNPLETIGENELINILISRGELDKDLLQRLQAHTSTKNSTNNNNKTADIGIHDISQISALSKTSFREQPSSANLKDQLQSFSYPLHSTMSYPLHSTMQNANLDIELSSVSDNESDISTSEHKCENVEILGLERKDEVNTSGENSSNPSSSGVSSNSDLKSSISKKYASLSTAKGVNMDKFSYDEGIMSSNEYDPDDSFFGQKPIQLPVTPANTVKEYYTLTYTPDCGSSVLSYNVDNDKHFDEDNRVHHCSHQSAPNNMVTCRCHLNTVHRIRRTKKVFSHRNPTQDFVESTLLMDSQVRDVRPIDNYQHPSCNNVKRFFEQYDSADDSIISNDSQSSTTAVVKMPNTINVDSMLNCVELSKMQDMESRTCHSISSIEPRMLQTTYSSRNKKSDIVVVKPHHIDSTNCLNFGKLLKTKDNVTKDIVETTIVNHTLGNPNVTMVAQGCLGGLLKKKSKKSSKQVIKETQNKYFTHYQADDDKENVPSRVRMSSKSSDKITRNSVKSQVSSSQNSFESSICGSSYLSDRDLKRKLSKRMRSFRDSTFTDPQKMMQQTLGQI